MTQTPGSIDLFATPEDDCNYLPGNRSTTIFADPNLPKDKSIHSLLSLQGFRRSGEFIYRPNCQHCNACVATRVPVAEFEPNRNQRRVWKRNKDITVVVRPAEFLSEHFALYQCYLQARHADGGMDNPTPESYMQFLSSSWSATFFMEFRLDNKLAAIAVIDQLNDGISAVYTFFDPELSKRSLGTFAILYEIEYSRQKGCKYLYLGYRIEECQKMKYKQDFQPQELFMNNHWVKVDKK